MMMSKSAALNDSQERLIEALRDVGGWASFDQITRRGAQIASAGPLIGLGLVVVRDKVDRRGNAYKEWSLTPAKAANVNFDESNHVAFLRMISQGDMDEQVVGAMDLISALCAAYSLKQLGQAAEQHAQDIMFATAGEAGGIPSDGGVELH